MRLTRAKPEQMRQIEAIYEAAFPDEERESFAILQNLKPYAFYVLSDGSGVTAFAAVIDITGFIVIDYLAVRGDMRGAGCGGAVLSGLKRLYAGKKGLFIEIERLGAGTPEENAVRERRRRFYIRNGFSDFPLDILFDGVKMQVMYLPFTVPNPAVEDYFAAFRGLESPKRTRIYPD